MKVAESFSPLEVGEIDAFAFDMTQRVGSSQIVDTNWTARLTYYSSGADPNPQKAISNSWVSQLALVNGIQKSGWYVFAMVGPFPASAAGATYILDAVAFLADGRIIADNSTVQCVLPGQLS